MGWLLEAPLEAEIRGLVLGRADKETKAGSCCLWVVIA